MKRRDFVKAIVAASTATAAAPSALSQQTAPPAGVKLPKPAPKPAAPAPWWSNGLLEVKPLPMTSLVPDAVADTDAKFFSSPQRATLSRLCEILQPPSKSGYPGAIDAGAPEFLDFLIGASPADRQQMYMYGLDRLESEAQQKFKVRFSEVTAQQADQLIRPWLRPWINEHPPKEPYDRFINLVHVDIRNATINSSAWAEVAQAKGVSVPDVDLYWYPIDPNLTSDTPRHS